VRFPSVDRVVYQRTSLAEVIAQVKFTPVLKIDTDVPSDVQEALRSKLPGYARQELGFPAGAGLPFQLPSQLVDRRAEHTFLSSNGDSTVTLGRDFVALSVRHYPRWEAFQSLLSLAVTAVQNAYAPNGLTRIGLRYQNVISRKSLGLDGLAWRELLLPSLLGLLAEDDALRPAAATRQELFDLEVAGGPATARVVHGTVATGTDAEMAYLIDSDFYVERDVSMAEMSPILEDLHAQSRSFFRKCVQQRLHLAMKPEEP
jgi:uncharacterized protein (TIGR04255 family)